jgi:hypothetical protein
MPSPAGESGEHRQVDAKDNNPRHTHGIGGGRSHSRRRACKTTATYMHAASKHALLCTTFLLLVDAVAATHTISVAAAAAHEACLCALPLADRLSHRQRFNRCLCDTHAFASALRCEEGNGPSKGERSDLAFRDAGVQVQHKTMK